MELPAVSLKVIIMAHWLLTVWGCMDYIFPASYAWGNFSVLAVGIWAIVQRDSLDAITMDLSDLKRFSVGMAIFSFLLKPVSCYLVYQMCRERGGDCTFNIDLKSLSDSYFAHSGIDVSSAGRDRSAYEPIDQQVAPPQWPDSSRTAQQPY
ncbi:type-1 angiotensin II receptor-associated protein isoform X3 [Pogoniulus pusillus]|uniref:type-1 angiotensin II receptor-associated protein isoform X3 n=1 Tax=Pogoniulus pusillus TaxID=488313 RepID=UPI0030B99362